MFPIIALIIIRHTPEQRIGDCPVRSLASELCPGNFDWRHQFELW